MPEYRVSTLSTAGLTFLNSGKRLLDEIQTVLLGTGTNWVVEHSSNSVVNYIMPRETAATLFPFDKQRKVFSRSFGGTTWYLEMYNECVELTLNSKAFDIQLIFWRFGTGYVSGPTITDCGKYRNFVAAWCESTYSTTVVPDLTVDPFSLTNQYAPDAFPLTNSTTDVTCVDMSDSILIGVLTENEKVQASNGMYGGRLINHGAAIKNLGYSSLKTESHATYNSTIQDFITAGDFNITSDHLLAFHASSPSNYDAAEDLVCQLLSTSEELPMFNTVVPAVLSSTLTSKSITSVPPAVYTVAYSYKSYFRTSFDIGSGVKSRAGISAAGHTSFRGWESNGEIIRSNDFTLSYRPYDKLEKFPEFNSFFLGGDGEACIATTVNFIDDLDYDWAAYFGNVPKITGDSFYRTGGYNLLSIPRYIVVGGFTV